MKRSITFAFKKTRCEVCGDEIIGRATTAPLASRIAEENLYGHYNDKHNMLEWVQVHIKRIVDKKMGWSP